MNGRNTTILAEVAPTGTASGDGGGRETRGLGLVHRDERGSEVRGWQISQCEGAMPGETSDSRSIHGVEADVVLCHNGHFAWRITKNSVRVPGRLVTCHHRTRKVTALK